MKKGLLAVLLLSFSVIALHAHNAGLNKTINAAVQRAAVKAEMADEKAEVYTENVEVKGLLVKFVRQHQNDELTENLKNILAHFDELTGKEDIKIGDFVTKITAIKNEVAQIAQKDKTFAEKDLLPALKKGRYSYRYEKYLFDYVFSRYHVMSWDEAVKVKVSDDTRMMHSM